MKDDKITKIYDNKKIHILLIIFTCLISSAFILIKGIYLGHDLEYHLSRILGISECLKYGDFKALIHPGFYGYGYANGLFYSNLFLYPFALLNAFGLDIITCYKIFIITITFGTALSMYYCVNNITKKSSIATISTILYITSAYRICDVMVRAAVGEILAFLFIPIIILGLYKLLYEDYKKWYIFSVGFVGLVNCHLISCVMMFLIIVVIILCNFTKLVQEKERIKYLFISGIVGLLLAAFFIIPMLEQYLRADLLINSNVNDIASIAPLSKVFVGLLNYKTKFFPGGIGLIFIIIIIIWFKLIIEHKIEKDNKINKFISCLIISGVLVLLGSTDIVPWKELSRILGSIQFTWRLYLFCTAFFSAAGGYIIDKALKGNSFRISYVCILIIYCISLCICNQFLGEKSLKIYHQPNTNIVLKEYNKFSIAAGEYIPKNTDWSLVYKDKRKPKTNNEELKIKYTEKKGKYYIEFKNNKGNDTYIDIPIINYLGYRAKSLQTSKYYEISEGYNTWVRVHLKNNKEDSLMIWYKGTKVTRISYWLSFISWLIFMLFLIYQDKMVEFCSDKVKKIEKNRLLNNAYTKAVIGTLFIITILFILRHLYPFGNQTISNTDMGQAYLPAYYNLWDFFHGKTGLFFNFNIGGGSNIYDTGSIYGFFSPINWLIALSSHNNIVYNINYLFIIKILFISLTSTILFKSLFKNVKDNIIAIYSCLYAFSGYIIIYYTNFPWLDLVGLFPLLVLSLKRIVDNKGFYLYTVLLSLSLIYSFYISYMILLFIIFSTGIYLFIRRKELDIKKITFELGIGTIIALGISAFAILPVIYQTMHSYRFGIASSSNHSTIISNIIFNKLMVICFYGYPYVFLIKGLSYWKKDKKKILFYIAIIFLTTITIIHEKANLIWHTGSYLYFPYRFAFIPILLIYLGSLEYHNIKDKKKEKKHIFLVIPTILILIMTYFYYQYKKLISYEIINKGLSNQAISYLLAGFIVSIIATFIITKLKYKRIRNIFLLAILLIQIIINAYIYIGIPRESLLREFNDESAFLATEIYEYRLKDNDIYRYKDNDYTLIENYPFITRTPSLSTWHMIDKEQRETHNFLGYATYGSKMIDKGGTLFSDQLLGINRIFSLSKLSADYYTLLAKQENYYIYKFNKSLPYGIIYDKDNYFETLDYKISEVDNYNNIYHKLFSTKDNLFTESNVISEIEKDCDKYIIDIKKQSDLYFKADIIDSLQEIKINGQTLKMPFINSYNSTNYNNTSGMVYLGNYKNETVEIIMKKNEKIEYKPMFLQLDSIKFKKFVENYSQNAIKYKFQKDKLTINTISNKNKALFLPITYNQGLKVSINGKAGKIKRAVGNFLSIDLKEGKNEIIISFLPPLFKLGIVITITSILLLILIKRLIMKNYSLAILQYMSKYIFILLWIAIFLYVYIIPIFK